MAPRLSRASIAVAQLELDQSRDKARLMNTRIRCHRACVRKNFPIMIAMRDHDHDN